MTAFKRGDIVLVPFPFSNQIVTKKRPAVVISSSRYNTVSKDIIIMAVTSQIGEPFESDAFSIKNWKEANLLKPSAIKPAVSTIEQALVLKKLGSLSDDDLIVLNAALKELLGL